MKTQKLKSFGDFLKRAEIIPHALLVITEDNSGVSDKAVKELRSLNLDLPFYELNVSDTPGLKGELAKLYGIDTVPTFIYFRGKKMVSKIIDLDINQNLTRFLTSAIHSDL